MEILMYIIRIPMVAMGIPIIAVMEYMEALQVEGITIGGYSWREEY